LTDRQRYNIWFRNNYETGMEYNFDPNNLPDFNDPYYTPTPKYKNMFSALPQIQIDEIVAQCYILPTVKITYDRWLNGKYELIFSFLKWELVFSV